MKGNVGPRWEVEEAADLLEHTGKAGVLGGLRSLSQLSLQNHLWPRCTGAAEEDQEEEEVH